MIIRSQDRKILTKFDSVSIVANYKRQYKGERKIVGYQIVVFIGSNTDVIVAEYYTEEKAIKVLDMIAQNYVESEKYIIRRVFQMPSDKEVEV